MTETVVPSGSPELSSLNEQVELLNVTADDVASDLFAVRALLLLSGGLLIFLLAALFMRSRKA